MCEHVNNSSKSIRISESLETLSQFGCVFCTGMGMVSQTISNFSHEGIGIEGSICFGACITAI